jgi:hypothetical protein
MSCGVRGRYGWRGTNRGDGVDSIFLLQLLETIGDTCGFLFQLVPLSVGGQFGVAIFDVVVARDLEPELQIGVVSIIEVCSWFWLCWLDLLCLIVRFLLDRLLWCSFGRLWLLDIRGA